MADSRVPGDMWRAGSGQWRISRFPCTQAVIGASYVACLSIFHVATMVKCGIVAVESVGVESSVTGTLSSGGIGEVSGEGLESSRGCVSSAGVGRGGRMVMRRGCCPVARIAINTRRM